VTFAVYALAALYAALSIWDVISTVRFLGLGLREANPVIRWTIENLGPLWPLPKLAMASLVIWIVLAWFPTGWALALLIPSCGLMAWVVWWNETQIARRKARLGLQ
jgi:hypothetical protein